MKQRVLYYGDAIYWTFNGKWHRDKDLPAQCDFDFRDGKLIGVSYCQHGKDHRATGPAIIYYVDKIKLYYYHGREYGSLGEMLMMEACR